MGQETTQGAGNVNTIGINENEGLSRGNTSPDPKGGIVNKNVCNDANVPVMTDSSSNVVHSESLQSEVVTEVTPQDIAQETARWQLPVYRGIFVQGVDATLTVDTGAGNTIVSRSLFGKFSVDHRPQLLEVCPTGGAGGETLKSYGKAVMEIRMGSLCFDHMCVVADIVDEVLLGEDLLLCDASGPTDIIQLEEKMMFKGVSIPLKTVLPSVVRQVTVAKDVMVPSMEEVIVNAYVDRYENQNEEEEGRLLVEMHPNLPEGYGCILASTIVDASSSTTVPICIFNPQSYRVVVKQDSVVGQVEPVDVVRTVSKCENPNEKGNCSATRRVLLNRESTLPSKTLRVTKGQKKSFVHYVQGSLAPLPEHLKELYEKSAKGKNEYQKKVIHWLLLKHQNVFSKNENDLGRMHLVEHTIDTGDAKPIKQPPRQLPMAFADEDRKALEKLQTQGVIQPSTSPWALPILLVKKKDGSTRPCVDYHRLNAVTRNDAYPVPRSQECLDSMVGSGMFSIMDILSAYNQVPVAEEDIPKTAFSTKYGLFEFITMPFGLMTAPATYQRLMELALSGLQWSLCLIYLDDVIVFSEDFDEQVDHLDQVLTHIGSVRFETEAKQVCVLCDKSIFLGA